MKRRGLRSAALAVRMDIRNDQLSHIFANRKKIDLDTANSLAEALGTSVEFWLSIVEDEKRNETKPISFYLAQYFPEEALLQIGAGPLGHEELLTLLNSGDVNELDNPEYTPGPNDFWIIPFDKNTTSGGVLGLRIVDEGYETPTLSPGESKILYSMEHLTVPQYLRGRVSLHENIALSGLTASCAPIWPGGKCGSVKVYIRNDTQDVVNLKVRLPFVNLYFERIAKVDSLTDPSTERTISQAHVAE